jgi:hypothetical protein
MTCANVFTAGHVVGSSVGAGLNSFVGGIVWTSCCPNVREVRSECEIRFETGGTLDNSAAYIEVSLPLGFIEHRERASSVAVRYKRFRTPRPPISAQP